MSLALSHSRLRFSSLALTVAFLLVAEARADPLTVPLPAGAVCRLGTPRLWAPGPIGGLAFSPDGKALAIRCGETALRLWDLSDGKLRTMAAPTQHCVHCMAFSPDGLTLASGDSDAMIQFREAAGGQVYRTLQGHAGTVTALAFAPDGRTLASAGADRTVILWSDRGTLRRRFEGHLRDVTCLAFTPDGRELVSGGEDGTIRLWNLAAGSERLKLSAASTGVQALVLTPDGKGLIAEGDGHVLRLWDPSSGREVRQFRGHSGVILALAITRGGETLASGSADGTIRLWEVASGTEKILCRSDKTAVSALAFAPDGKTLAAGYQDHVVNLWRLEKGGWKDQMVGQRAPVDGVAFSADGREVITRAGEESLRWDAATGRLLGTAKEKPPVQVVVEARSPDGKIVLTQGETGAVLCREAATGEKIFELRGHNAPLTSLAFSADGRAFVSGGADTAAVVWDLMACLPSVAPRHRGPWMKDLDLLWGELEKEGESAYQALRLLSAMPDKAFPFLKGKVPYLSEARRLRKLVADLDDDAFAVREAASRELAKLGPAAEVVLRQALRETSSVEVRRRAQVLLKGIEEVDETVVLCWRRAIWMLELNGSPEARRVLEAAASGTLGDKVRLDARSALDRLDKREKGR
jgi:WD40 repeat protein